MNNYIVGKKYKSGRYEVICMYISKMHVVFKYPDDSENVLSFMYPEDNAIDWPTEIPQVVTVDHTLVVHDNCDGHYNWLCKVEKVNDLFPNSGGYSHQGQIRLTYTDGKLTGAELVEPTN